MDEVRSYWQVASISHFCNIFGKQFKLPTFEPEELEQAFILDIPAPPTNTNNASATNINNINNNSNNNNDDDDDNDNNITNADNIDHTDNQNYDDDPDWLAPGNEQNGANNHHNNVQAQSYQSQQPPAEQPEQRELHLLVKLAIALLKPHFNCKISHANWENYLRRIVDSNWVQLERHPSPFRVPLISQDGVELTKNLVFNELPLSDKIDLFYALCDYRLWCEDANEALKDYTLEELRLNSIGKDSQGYEYWYFSGTRLFRENKELSLDIILRKKRIKELEYKLVELEKDRIIREQEEKRKVELERARQLAAEAREVRLAAKKQQEQAANKKRKSATPILPPRTGLRERRSSATSNNNDSQQSRTTRSKQAKQQEPEQQQQPTPQKNTRSLAKNSKHNDQRQEKTQSPDLPKKAPEEECRDELERLAISSEDRAAAWCIECDSLEDWENFATKFVKTKSTNEKYLSCYINEHILPKIRAIYAKRAAEAKRKEKELILSLASRRVSTRIISKRAQEEEEERQAQIHEAEMRRKRVEAEARLRADLEREHRAKANRERFLVNGGASSTCSDEGEDLNGRYNLRQQHQQQMLESNEFDGIIHPDHLSDFYEALELVIDTVRTSKHAWPFVDPVPNTVPGYYDLIKEPMDLKKLRTKIEFREYKSLIEVEKDFQKLVNNCEHFNGPRNVYTKMVYKLWKSFRKNVRLYLQRDLSMNEYETFVYPPPPPPSKLEPKLEQEPELQPQPDLELDPAKDEELTPVVRTNAVQEMVDSEMKRDPETTNNLEQTNLDIKLEQAGDSVKQDVKLELVPNGQLEPVLKLELQPESPEPKAPTPEPITMGEEIIIDSYDVPCPDESFFIWPQEAKPT